MERCVTVFLVFLLGAGTARADRTVGPGQSIQSAIAAAAPGEVITVLAGTYNENLTVNKSLTLQAVPSRGALVDGTAASSHVVRIQSGLSQVKVIGFRLTHSRTVSDKSGVRMEGWGADIEVRDNEIYDMRGNDAMGVTFYGTSATPLSNIKIIGNYIHHCEPAQSEALVVNGNVDGFEIIGNTVTDVNNIGIDMIGGESLGGANVARNGVCRANRVARARSNYGGGYGAGIYVDGGRDIVIEGNVVQECDLGLEIGAENPGFDATGIIVRNNVIFENDKAGIAFGGYAAGVGRVRLCTFVNNTLYRNNQFANPVEWQGEFWMQFASDNQVRNNIVVAALGTAYFAAGIGTNNLLSHNLWFGAGAGPGTNAVNADPLFVNAAAGDFHLLAASPAVDGGVDLGAVLGSADIDGQPRVQGSAPDIGADERSGVGMPTKSATWGQMKALFRQ